MEKPNKNIINLYNLGYIKSIEVVYRQTGTDTADTFVVIKGSTSRAVKGLWSTYKEYLNVKVDYNSVAELKSQFKNNVVDWISSKKKTKKSWKNTSD